MSIYNVKVYEYAESRQLRIYKTPVTDTEHRVKVIRKKDRDEKNPKTVRTPQQIEHSARVSQQRSKQAIFEISRANKWDWFITLTFNQKRIDSSDYDLLVGFVRKWFNNVKNRKCPDLKYLIIPELHKDGIHYHFHGLLSDADGLHFIDSGIVQDGKTVYNIFDFPYGFTTATRVEDSKRVSSYISKYITKELSQTLPNKRRYLASKNCNRAEIVKAYIPPDQINMMLVAHSADITHISQRDISSAHQRVQYIELNK